MFNKWRQPSWIYGKLVSFHRSDFRGFLICFSFVDSELFGSLYIDQSVNFTGFGIFYNYNIYFFIKNQFGLSKICPPPPLYFCIMLILKQFRENVRSKPPRCRRLGHS